MKAAGCDFVRARHASSARPSAPIGEARKTGFSPTFIGSSAAYTDLIHKLGGKPMDGLYATMTVQNPVPGRASQPMQLLGQQVQDQVQRRPDGVLGLRLQRSSTRFATAARQGRRRTSRPTASSRRWTSMTFEPDMFGSAPANYLHGHQAPRQRPVAPVASCRTGAGRSSPTTSSRTEARAGRCAAATTLRPYDAAAPWRAARRRSSREVHARRARRASRGAAPRPRSVKSLADGRAQVVDAQVDRAELAAKRRSAAAGGSSMWRAPIAAITARPAMASSVGADHAAVQALVGRVADQLGLHRRGCRSTLPRPRSRRCAGPSTLVEGDASARTALRSA